MQFFFQQRAAAHHHVAAAAVQLRDAHLHFRAGQVVQILRGPQVVLRARQERAYADIHHQPALDAVHYLAGNRFFRFERRVDLLPRPAAQHFQVRQDREAVLVLPGALHFDRAVRLRARYFRVREFRRRNQPFRLSAQVHHHAMFRVRDNLDLDHLVRRCRFLLLVVLLQQLAHLFRAGRFFIGGGSFGIRGVRVPVCFGRGMGGRDIGRRTRPFRRRSRGFLLSRAYGFGMFRCSGRSSLLCRAFYR